MSRSASKVALITGCDTEDGIGQAVCHELLQRGYYVYATGVALGNMESLKKSKPESVHTMVMDVTKEEEVQNVVAEVFRQAGRIDLVVNNAGIPGGGPTVEADLAFCHRVFDVNFWGTWAVCKAVGAVMARQRSGTIVNIGSMAGRAHTPFGGVYCSSKAAVESITHSLRVEMKPFGVNVVLVAPAWIKTGIARGDAGLGKRESWEQGLYGGWAYDALRNEVERSIRTGWPVRRIAQRIAKAGTAKRPPRFVYGGGQSKVLGMILRLPRSLVDKVFSGVYGLSKWRPGKGAAQAAAAVAVTASSGGAGSLAAAK